MKQNDSISSGSSDTKKHFSKVKQAFSIVQLLLHNLYAMADEEPCDQKKYYEDSCKPKCVQYLIGYQECVKRIQSDNDGNKHCTGQYFDYWSCVDKCAAPQLFQKLK